MAGNTAVVTDLDKICAIITSRHTDARIIILLNDTYDWPLNIKNGDHDRRAARYSQIPNIFRKPEDAVPEVVEHNKSNGQFR